VETKIITICYAPRYFLIVSWSSTVGGSWCSNRHTHRKKTVFVISVLRRSVSLPAKPQSFEAVGLARARAIFPAHWAVMGTETSRYRGLFDYNPEEMTVTCDLVMRITDIGLCDS
jgi:hypothetical protein